MHQSDDDVHRITFKVAAGFAQVLLKCYPIRDTYGLNRNILRIFLEVTIS